MTLPSLASRVKALSAHGRRQMQREIEPRRACTACRAKATPAAQSPHFGFSAPKQPQQNQRQVLHKGKCFTSMSASAFWTQNECKKCKECKECKAAQNRGPEPRESLCKEICAWHILQAHELSSASRAKVHPSSRQNKIALWGLSKCPLRLVLTCPAIGVSHVNADMIVAGAASSINISPSG